MTHFQRCRNMLHLYCLLFTFGTIHYFHSRLVVLMVQNTTGVLELQINMDSWLTQIVSLIVDLLRIIFHRRINPNSCDSQFSALACGVTVCTSSEANHACSLPLCFLPAWRPLLFAPGPCSGTLTPLFSSCRLILSSGISSLFVLFAAPFS